MTARDAQRRTLGIVWAALLSSAALYLGLGLALGGRLTSSVVEAVPALAGILGLASLGALGFAHWVWNEGLRAPSRDPGSVAILAWALDESVAVCGLVLAILGFPSLQWLPFVVVSVIFLLVHRPGAIPAT